MQECLYRSSFRPCVPAIETFTINSKRVTVATRPSQPLHFCRKSKNGEEKSDILNLFSDIILEVEFLRNRMKSSNCSELLIPENILRINAIIQSNNAKKNGQRREKSFFLGNWVHQRCFHAQSLIMKKRIMKEESICIAKKIYAIIVEQLEQHYLKSETVEILDLLQTSLHELAEKSMICHSLHLSLSTKLTEALRNQLDFFPDQKKKLKKQIRVRDNKANNSQRYHPRNQN